MAEEQTPEEMNAISVEGHPEGTLHCNYPQSWEQLKEHLVKYQKDHPTAFDSIHTLTIETGNIDSFPSGAFSGFLNLTCLKITECKTTKLSTEAFEMLEKLKELSLENEISEIPVDFFKNLTSLETVDMSCNKIQTIKSGTFSNLANLKELILTGNQLKTLGPDAFKGLIALETLGLAESNIEKLEDTLFRDLKNLKLLILFGNAIESDSLGVLNDLDSLQNLHLAGNKIASMKGVNPKHVNTLFLNNNSITCLPEDFSQNFGEVELLELSKNIMTEIHPKAFQGLNKLKKVYLNYCKFTKVPAELFKNIKVDHALDLVSFEGNNLKVLPKDTFNGFCKLTALYMETCKIEKIEAGTFKGLASLVELHLQNNYLRKLEPGMFEGLTQLRRLELESNKIISIEDGCFKDLKSLRILNLDGNLLTSLKHSGFKDLTDLMWLSVKYNNLKNVETVEGLENLRFLDLSSNRLECVLDDCFSGLNQLTYLYLAGCGLEKIGTLSSGVLSKLVELNITCNKLTDLSLAFFKHISPSCILKVCGNKIPMKKFVEIFNEHPDITLCEESN